MCSTHCVVHIVYRLCITESKCIKYTFVIIKNGYAFIYITANINLKHIYFRFHTFILYMYSALYTMYTIQSTTNQNDQKPPDEQTLVSSVISKK